MWLRFKGLQYVHRTANVILKPKNKSQHCKLNILVSDKVNQCEKVVTRTKVTDARAVEPTQYNFRFENLVFEGGGNKGMAYIGCIKYLEELGLMDQMKRFGGTSAGAITAGHLALGYTADELDAIMNVNLNDLFEDSGLLQIPNLLQKYGMNTGEKVYDWFGENIRKKSWKNDPDMTFYQLYRERGVELCVVVIDLSVQRAVYCHPKTTPNIPIRKGLIMSMSIPILFQPWSFKSNLGENICVDGGFLCNYPIKCFDGWYLSMDKRDRFLKRYQPLSDIDQTVSTIFNNSNDKTMGFLVYADYESDPLRWETEKRLSHVKPVELSEMTELYRKMKKEIELEHKHEFMYSEYIIALEALLNSLEKNAKDNMDNIDRAQLQTALSDRELVTKEQTEILFGSAVGDVDKLFSTLDVNADGRVSLEEFLLSAENESVGTYDMYLGRGRRSVNSWKDFLIGLVESLFKQITKATMTAEDMERTVGINTGHVGTLDYTLETADREFVKLRGYYATEAFLKYYIVQNPDKVQLKTNQTPG